MNTQNATNLNEDLKKEMDDVIYWSASTSEPKETESKETELKIEDKAEMTEPKETEVKDEIKPEVTDNKEAENKVDNQPKVEKPKSNKPRNVNKTGDKDWTVKISDNEKLDETCIFHYEDNKFNKLGRFVKYGKKEGIIWVKMFKKDSFDTMTKDWAVKISECELVGRDGKMFSPEKFYMDDKGYHIVKDKKETEAAVTNNAVPTNETIETLENTDNENIENETIENEVTENIENEIIEAAENNETAEKTESDNFVIAQAE